MKQFFYIVFLLLVLTACDDGNLTVDIIDFSDVVAQKCSSKEVVYKVKNAEMLFIEIPDITFINDETQENQPIEVTTSPRTALISATNKLSYRLYSNTITDAYFCATPIPSTPTLAQQWNAVDAVEATSGIIEVSTTTLGSSFQHTIRLKKVSLNKGNSSFSLGDDYLFGTMITN